MKIVREGGDFGAVVDDFERANGELDELEAFGGMAGLEVGDFGGIEGGDTVPGGGE